MRTSPYCSKKVTEVIAVITEAYRYLVLLEKYWRTPFCRGYTSLQIRLRYDGDLFDLRRLKAKTKALTEFISMLMTLLFSATRQRVCNRF